MTDWSRYICRSWKLGPCFLQKAVIVALLNLGKISANSTSYGLFSKKKKKKKKNWLHLSSKNHTIVFSRDQNNCDTSGAYVLWSDRNDKHMWNTAQCAKILDAFCLCLCLVVGKNLNTPTEPAWLMTPLHGAVWESWDLPSVSVM